ncbi:vanadium-dependent haloperoxidase [Rubrivirga sp.]|uniref:vanadium-dependent haloperoxidase n=1 Tax=Rubrivirga sp. TaxID=1885344 RepID=UPI003B51C76A
MNKLLPLLAVVALAGCAEEPARPPSQAEGRAVVLASVQSLTDAMVYDIFSPPQASRVYAYATVAGYEAARLADPGLASYAGRLNGLDPLPEPDGAVDPLLAATQAFFRVADAMVFSQDRLGSPRDSALAAFDGIDRATRRRSLAYGDAVAEHVLAWADADGYARTRSLTRYTPADAPGAWQPTPPAYIEAIEPYWGELRPFVLDSVGAYRAPPPSPFSTAPGSAFFQEVREVYDETTDMTDEERLIASFWDCNPFVLHEDGHLSYATKKISPGGHWMGIVGIAVEANRDTPARAWAAFSQTAVALADAFIVSWADKYRTNLVRPETVIRQTLDPTWQPLLQTPPFPEYTSGHSVISTAAAEVLTSIYGDVAFVDDVEVPYGLPERRFESFRAAAAEAAISRLYGGIHYRPAIENGVVQGRAVGETVVSRLGLGSPSLATFP